MNGPTRALSDDERLDWLRLIRSESIGPRMFFRLLDRFGSAAAALDAAPALARRGGRRAGIRMAGRDEAIGEIESLDRIGARLIARGEAGYPAALDAIPDPPPLISVRGDVGLLARPALAVVGARNASAAGRRFARGFAAELGQAGLAVVSGLARGIDAAAHEGALETGTAAVLAGGVDVVYPRENAGLYDEVAGRGALLSEQPPGTVPTARYFPPRNRIVSGLSLGVVVVEAAIRSGSLITARTALDQGREVFAVPGSPLDPRARGANDLIRNGAVLTETPADVLETIAGPFGAAWSESGPPARDEALAEPPEPSDGEVESGRDRVAGSIGAAPVTVDELVRECQLSAAVVATVLLELELAGRIERHPGQRVSRIAQAVSERT